MIRQFVRAILNNEVIKGSAAALAIKFTASIVGFVMFALAARYMEPKDFGSLAIIFNTLSFLSIVALFGQETLIVRSWDEYCRSNRPALACGVVSFGLKVTLGSAIVVAILTGVLWKAFDDSVSTTLIFAGCIFLLMHSLMQFAGQFSRVAAGVIIGELPRELMWRFFVVVAITSIHFLNINLGASEFFMSAAVALFVALAVQAVFVAQSIPAAVRSAIAQTDIRTWIPRSFKMWASALLDTTGQYLEVVLIGFVLGPAAAGLYFVATRITNVFAMINGSVSIYATSQISALFYSDARLQLQKMLFSLAVISVVLNGIALLIIIVAGTLLLSIFGPVYVSAYSTLIVLAAGASIGALVGPATHVLLLTGHEGAYPRIMAPVLLLRVVLIIAFALPFGLIGAAIAWSISTVFQALALIVACRRLVGIDPSLNHAFWRGRKEASDPRFAVSGSRHNNQTHALPSPKPTGCSSGVPRCQTR